MPKWLLLFVLAGALLLSACSTSADLKIINRTDHNIYVTVDGKSHTIAGDTDKDTTLTIEIDTGTRLPFEGSSKGVVIDRLVGDTFDIDPNAPSVSSTKINLTPDQTYKVFCDPTCAALKVFNNTSPADSINVNRIQLVKSNSDGSTDDIELSLGGEITPGQEKFFHIAYATVTTPFTYEFLVYTTDGREHYGYGVLYLDDVYQMDIEDR